MVVVARDGRKPVDGKSQEKSKQRNGWNRIGSEREGEHEKKDGNRIALTSKTLDGHKCGVFFFVLRGMQSVTELVEGGH